MWQFSWMFNLIPDSWLIWLTYVMLTVGVLLYVASKLVAWLPMIRSYKLPFEFVGIILYGCAAYFLGGFSNEEKWITRVKELEEKIRVAEEKSQEVNTIIKTKVIYKTKIVKQKQIEYVDRIKEVAVQIDAKCDVDPEAIEILNKAAEDPTKVEEKK
jgi:hypothetical protein